MPISSSRARKTDLRLTPVRGLARVALDATGTIEEPVAHARPPCTSLHPGTILRDRVLLSVGSSVTRAARDLGVCRQTLHRIPAGTAAVTPEMALRLDRMIGIAGRVRLDLQQAHDLMRAEADLAEAPRAIPVHASPPTIANQLSPHAR